MPTHTDIAGNGAGVTLGHVGGAFHVACQNVTNGATFLELSVKRIDGRARHTEGLSHAFFFHHQNCGHCGLHLRHVQIS